MITPAVALPREHEPTVRAVGNLTAAGGDHDYPDDGSRADIYSDVFRRDPSGGPDCLLAIAGSATSLRRSRGIS
jgi:hypothetical protein